MHLSQSISHEQEFAQWLLNVGHGRKISPDRTIAFDHNMRVDDANDLINYIYPNIDNVVPSLPFFLN